MFKTKIIDTRDKRNFTVLVIGAFVILLLLLILSSPVLAGGRPLSATLTGANEVPAGSGDLGASGSVDMTINVGQNEVCFNLTTSNLTNGSAFASHIHRGAAGVNGPVVVTLATGSFTSASGCVSPNSGDKHDLRDILINPSAYYVNVHTAPNFGPGAIRGQLEK